MMIVYKIPMTKAKGSTTAKAKEWSLLATGIYMSVWKSFQRGSAKKKV